MFRIETSTTSGRERARFSTAFYRFLELSEPPADEVAWLETIICADGDRLTAHFLCHEIARQFEEYLSAFKLPGAGPVAPWLSEHRPQSRRRYAGHHAAELER